MIACVCLCVFMFSKYGLLYFESVRTHHVASHLCSTRSLACAHPRKLVLWRSTIVIVISTLHDRDRGRDRDRDLDCDRDRDRDRDQIIEVNFLAVYARSTPLTHPSTWLDNLMLAPFRPPHLHLWLDGWWFSAGSHVIVLLSTWLLRCSKVSTDPCEMLGKGELVLVLHLLSGYAAKIIIPWPCDRKPSQVVTAHCASNDWKLATAPCHATAVPCPCHCHSHSHGHGHGYQPMVESGCFLLKRHFLSGWCLGTGYATSQWTTKGYGSDSQSSAHGEGKLMRWDSCKDSTSRAKRSLRRESPDAAQRSCFLSDGAPCV